MPDIVLPHTPTAGAVTNPAGLLQDLYGPAAVPNTFEVMDGWLDVANLDLALNIGNDHVQPRSACWGGMVGSSRIVDIPTTLFPLEPTEPGGVVPIDGACSTFWLPVATRTLWVVWQITIANALLQDGSFVSSTQLRHVFDGTTTDIVRLPRTIWNATAPTRRTYRDRTFTCHFMQVNPTVGEHRSSLRLWARGDGTALGNSFDFVTNRIRVRNSKWFAF